MASLDRKAFWWGLVAIVWMALSLGPSFAHLLEAWPRIMVWSPQLWRQTTVFNQQFMFFAIIGAPLDLGAIFIGAIFAGVLRRDRPAFTLALAATLLYAISLATWFAVVAPANGVLATWSPGPVPANFSAIRMRWETGHIVMAGIKLAGLVCAVLAALSMRRAPKRIP